MNMFTRPTIYLTGSALYEPSRWDIEQTQGTIAVSDTTVRTLGRYFLDSTDSITADLLIDTNYGATTGSTITFDTHNLFTYSTDDLYFQRLPGSRRGQLRSQHTHQIPRNHRGATARAAKVSFDRVTPEEIRALQLLRGLISTAEFRRYLKSGFVRVTGSSGLTYQVHRNDHTIHVWEAHQVVARLCLYLDPKFPPTDGVVSLMLTAQYDEPALWRRANVRWKKDASVAAGLRAA